MSAPQTPPVGVQGLCPQEGLQDSAPKCGRLIKDDFQTFNKEVTQKKTESRLFTRKPGKKPRRLAGSAWPGRAEMGPRGRGPLLPRLRPQTSTSLFLTGKPLAVLGSWERGPSAVPAPCSDSSGWPHTAYSTPCDAPAGLLAREWLVRKAEIGMPRPRPRQRLACLGGTAFRSHHPISGDSLGVTPPVSIRREQGHHLSVSLGRGALGGSAAWSLWGQRPCGGWWAHWQWVWGWTAGAAGPRLGLQTL